MKTQLQKARAGVITPEMHIAAQDEPISAEGLCSLMARGRVVLPKNVVHDFSSIKAIGEGLKTKVNANLGTSGECADMAAEEKKLAAALRAGADSIMDLSTGGDLDQLRWMFLKKSPVMLGTVPIYGLAAKMLRQGRPMHSITSQELFGEIELQCSQGVDYITVHCGITRQSVRKLEHFKRIMPCVSRGGSLHMQWIRVNGQENPLYQDFEVLLDIAEKYDVTLSLGDGFRPGCIQDSLDGAQVEELMILAELAGRAFERGVQVMIEGPGHVPLNEIKTQIQLQKRLCRNAPFYVLGPLPTDIAAGYDHITSAIGGAIAGAAGADFLCYVTPAEHLGLPGEDDVHQGVMAARIAAHIADLSKGLPGAADKDRQMAHCRQTLDWEGMIASALDPDLVRSRMQIAQDGRTCSMCGKLCAVKTSEETEALQGEAGS
ncbi:phosphomethylpyrimidine synthase ThiC [Desulfonatronospira sp.]|uniref:phosphomethylpyrimidine synthase ThiC n=1 Tax=Desulfonatronospira sp. TaxID=1962951 RepID=UPI0025B961E5|nr:phosphomethylpyrimidine synthase ThiC [Desulfonatronospira sp.]